MIRLALSLAAAAGIAVSGYGALGVLAGTQPAPPLKVIAVVVAHPHHRAAAISAPQAIDRRVLL